MIGKTIALLVLIAAPTSARLNAPSTTDRDAFCVGAKNTETCTDKNGNFVPTVTNNQTLGTSGLQWNNGYFNNLTGGNLTITGGVAGNLAIAGPNPWIDVTAPPYNADNTGTIDATTAIQSAINACPNNGCTVFLPDGSYSITSTITLRCAGNIDIIGDSIGGNATIAQKTPGRDVFFIDGTGCGSQPNRFAFRYFVIAVASGAANGIEMKSVAQVWVESMLIDSVSAASTNTVGGNGIQFSNGSNQIVISNSSLELLSTGVKVIGSRDIRIVNNLLDENSQQGADIGSSTDVLIQGNTVTNNNGNGIYVHDTPSFSANNQYSSIVGNFVGLTGATSISVTTSASPGIQFSNAKGVIASNQVYNGYGTGIYVTNSDDVGIVGNWVGSNVQGGGVPTYPAGIAINADAGKTATRINVVGNNITDTQVTKTQQYGIETGGSGLISSNTYVGNVVTSNSVSGINLTGSEVQPIIFGNYGYTLDKTWVPMFLNGGLTTPSQITASSVTVQNGAQVNGFFQIGTTTKAYTSNNGGSELVGGQMIVQGTSSVAGNAFSVGGTTMVVANGNVTVASSVTASGFFGDGSHLTGVTAESVPAGNLINGPVSSSILPSTVAYTSVANSFTANQTITGTSSNFLTVNTSSLTVAAGGVQIGAGSNGGAALTVFDGGRGQALEINNNTRFSTTGNVFNISGIAANTNINILPGSGNVGLGTSSGTVIYRCSGGTDGGWLLYGNSGAAQTLCTGGGGSLVSTGVALP